jgi:hypothetical protein
MADGNAALRDIASSRQRYSSRGCNSCGYSSHGCKLATLRWRYCFAAMASQADELLWRAGSTAPLLCNDDAAGSTATLFCNDGARRTNSYRAEFFYFFFFLGSFNGLFYAREKENDKLLYAQVHAREKEKKKARKRKKERALKPVWSSSSQLLVLLLQS